MPRFSVNRTRLRAWGIPAVALLAGAAIGVGAMTLWGSSEGASAEALGAGGAGGGANQQTVTVATQTLEQAVDATGTLAAVASADLSFDASGTVTKVNVEAGDTVEEGDVIATIDTLQLTASLTSAQADLAQAEATLADLEDAADGSDSSDAQIASAQSQVDLFAESVADAKDAMSDATLVADMSGLVTAQPFAVGDVVAGGSSAASSSSGSDQTDMGATTDASTSTSASSAVTIVGQDQWTVAVSLSEADVALIDEGDQVTFTSDDYDGEFYGIVSDVANLPTTTGGSATYAVDLMVTGTVEGLYEGTSVDASIVYQRETDVLAIPTNAITTTDGVSTVTVVGDDGETTEQEITTGDSIGAFTEITDGVSQGDELQVTVMTGGGTGTDGEDQSGFGEGRFPGGGDFPTDGQLPGGGQMPGGS